jgi:hypothetical protein
MNKIIGREKVGVERKKTGKKNRKWNNKMKKELKDRVSVLVVLEREQIRKIDTAAGKGNRSAYLRGLIDLADEKDIGKLRKLKRENETLKSKMKDLAAYEANNTIAASIVDQTLVEYRKWREQMEAQRREVNLQNELSWVTIRARSLSVKPVEFLETLHGLIDD